MGDEIATTTPKDLLVRGLAFARDPQGLALAQRSLLDFFSDKCAEVRSEIADLEQEIKHVKELGYQARPLQPPLSRARRRLLFYEKCLAAVEAGYILVPDFPVDVVAVRTTQDPPVGEERSAGPYYRPTPPAIEAEHLPAGEGEYVHRLPKVARWKTTEKKAEGGEATIEHLRVTDHREVEFPLIATKPMVLDAANRAMALKLFDEIGICPPSRAADPILVGRIGYSGNGRWTTKSLSFLIAWFVDLKQL